jgi:hypothetical protein
MFEVITSCEERKFGSKDRTNRRTKIIGRGESQSNLFISVLFIDCQ